MLETNAESPLTDVPLADLGPLAWVFEELRKSLDAANKAIKRFIRETEQSRHDDLEAADPSSLRVARQQLHQAVGALEMVGLEAPAQVLRATEAAVQRFVQRPQDCDERAATKVEQASFALVEYLEAILNNKPMQPVALFAQYRDVQELAAAERVHPSDLWPYEQRGVDVAAPVDTKALKADASLRSLFDRLVLLVVKTNSLASALQLARMCAGLSAGASEPRQTTFWRVAAAFFEALGHKLLSPDVYTKRAGSRILMQFASMVKGQSQVSETLLHDLLFFCTQVQGELPTAAVHLKAVREAFGLGASKAVDYQKATLGLYDPAILAQARKRIHSAKEAWSLYSGGDASRARPVIDQFGLVCDSLLKLHPASSVLAQALVKAVDLAAREPEGVKPELAMEVATTTLYLEAVFSDFDPNTPELTERTQALAGRLERVLGGSPAQPLEPWMELLYRSVSDRQTMGSVVGELKVSLNEAEKSLDQFFRTPHEKGGLHVAISHLAQMRGVLSVLGLEQAVQTVARMRSTVEQILDTEVDEARAREAGTFQQLGNNLSALSFLVDMLNYQPALAKKLFVFDEEQGLLLPLMGRTPAAARGVVADEGVQAIREQVQRVVDGADDGINLSELSEQLDQLATQAGLADQTKVAQAASRAAEAVAGNDAAAGAQALVGLSQSAPFRESVTPADDSGADNEEDDLLDIFLEEAREVVANGHKAVTALQASPDQLEELTTLRRAFHTLKGSSRMVGLQAFGEAAWSMEQLFNTLLGEQRAASPDLLKLSGEALQAFGHWVQDITDRADDTWSARPFQLSAQAWRDEARYLPLNGTTVAPPEAEGAEMAEPQAMAADAVVDPPQAPEPVSESASLDQAESPATEEPDFDLPLELDAELPQADFVDSDHLSPDSLFTDVPGHVPEAPPMLADFDLDALAQVSAKHASDQALEQSAEFSPVELPVEPVPVAEADALHVEEPSSEPPEAESLVPEVEIEAADTVDLVEPGDGLDVEIIDTGDATDALASFDEVDAQGLEPVLSEALPPADGSMDFTGSGSDVPDEQTKLIGSLRIGLKLYNVYLNEADEWSRRLGTALAEWNLERHETIPEQAGALAHSLAGSSATVGFQSLSQIARALEHAIETVGAHQQEGRAASAEQAQLFVDAAEEIRRLLHQFAAGFLKEANPELLAALYQVVHEWIAGASESSTAVVADTPPGASAAAAPDIDISGQWADASAAAPQAPSIADKGRDFESTAFAHEVTEFSPLSSSEPVRSGPVQDIDDDIDVLDTIDIDLFPIFSEEAHELLPLLGGALRQWVARPDNASARAEVLRSLHTLKGSARLAGALRLGEMAHRMETVAERLGSDVQRSEALEPLSTAFDAIMARFDLLRHTDLPLQGVVQRAPEQAPVDAAPESRFDDAPQPAESTALPAAPATGGTDLSGLTMPRVPVRSQARAGAAVRVRPELLDRLVNQTGEVITTRSRMESELVTLRGSLKDLTGNLDRLRQQLRDIELQAETQMQSRLAQARDADQSFDPLEFDRFTRVQELTRMMAESVNDVATVQRNLQRAVEATEDGLVAQGRQTRDLQRDLLRTRMVEFEGISERLYRVVRQASKETGKQVRLDISGGQIEMDRGVLDRMGASFEHLLRNSVVHGIEMPEARLAAGKSAEGQIEIRLAQERNDVSVVFLDDGAGLNLASLREKAQAQGFVQSGAELDDAQAAQLVFAPGLSTASEVSELAGRGIGMDVVRADVIALGGRIETATREGQGTSFKLVLPLTTAVTQVVMLRAGALTFGVPSNVVELVRRVPSDELNQAYANNSLRVGDEDVPFYWTGALLQSSAHSNEPQGRTLPVVIFRSAAQRVAMHVDEVLGNQEVVVKNLGPQLSRLPGLAGMSVLASGAVALIYNPVALASVYGSQVRDWVAQNAQMMPAVSSDAQAVPDMSASMVPLILVVDDSITVRRVTQRLLKREGYRVTLASDGLQALERLQVERPTVVLTDIEMPRMDGFDLVRNIRSDANLAGLPVIMITSRIAEKHRVHARELGVDHYLGKPYSEDELLALVARYAQAVAEA
ncbi:Hpt domain-containing protein [Hydrogenophaga sp.]|uniref:hybrid sensor histidine kinase/response regulator n=1 Tax=Hydrogenophaga sp. TaxID=1904254 RepID=UPI00356A0D0B